MNEYENDLLHTYMRNAPMQYIQFIYYKQYTSTNCVKKKKKFIGILIRQKKL